MIAVPLPANNYFLNVLAPASGPSLYLWFCLSAAAEYMVSRGLQPAPRSACLGTLISYPDWEEFTSTFVTDTEPVPDITTFLILASSWVRSSTVTRFYHIDGSSRPYRLAGAILVWQPGMKAPWTHKEHPD
jgi:hypothetical protein